LSQDGLELRADGGRFSDNTFRIVGSNHAKEAESGFRGGYPWLLSWMRKGSLLERIY
jgi:hypothetical protein